MHKVHCGFRPSKLQYKCVFRHFMNNIAKYSIYRVIGSIWGHSLLVPHLNWDFCIFTSSDGIIITFSVHHPHTHIIHPCHFKDARLSTNTSISEAKWNLPILLLLIHRNIASTLNVTAGEYDLSHIDPGEQTLTIETIIIHPYFSIKKPMDYDIALLKMDGAFHFGKH